MKKKTKKAATSNTTNTKPSLTENEWIDVKELLYSDGYKALGKIFDQALVAKATFLLEDRPGETESDVYKEKLKITGARELVAGIFSYLNHIKEEKQRKEA